jgi:hypothetical protein
MIRFQLWALLFLSIFVFGIAIGKYSHPYERCDRMYDDPDEISECVWILTNP